ncbi:unannotated protein [freshwater metagenome]|uniref:Unannotated protein n=1 Tax=freshwater metagenome TaxID=449393 RepID=A0A6J7RML5_9ZZZZ
MSVQPISGSITAFSHARPGQTDDALRHLIGLAHSRDLTVRLDPEETAKHPSIDAGPGVELNAELDRDAGLAVAFGGDGTVLRALRAYAGTSVPVIGINFGEIGFLAAIDRDDVAAGLEGAVRANSSGSSYRRSKSRSTAPLGLRSTTSRSRAGQVTA